MKILSLVLALMFLTGCVGTVRDKKESERLCVTSQKLLDENRLQEAEPIIEKAIELWPENYVAYNNRAFLKLKQNKPSREVLADYKKCLSLQPDYEVALFSLVNYYSEIEDYPNVVRAANVYLARDPGNLPDKNNVQIVYSNRAEARYQCGNFTDAMRDARTAIRINKSSPGAYKTLGDCYRQLNSPDSAILQYNLAISLSRNYFRAYLARGMAYETLQTEASLKLAAKDYQAAYSINPHADSIYGISTPVSRKVKEAINTN